MANKSKLVKQLESLLLSYGLVQYIKNPKRITMTTRTLIDVIYNCTSSFIESTVISDHYLVGTVRLGLGLTLDYTPLKKLEITGRTYRNYTFDLAKAYYARVNRDWIYMCHDVDGVWELLFKIITNCANVVCPIRTMKINANRLPWLTPEVIEVIHVRDDLFLEAFASSDQSLLTQAKELKTKGLPILRNS